MVISQLVIKGEITKPQVCEQMLETFECQHVFVTVLFKQLFYVKSPIRQLSFGIVCLSIGGTRGRGSIRGWASFAAGYNVWRGVVARLYQLEVIVIVRRILEGEVLRLIRIFGSRNATLKMEGKKWITAFLIITYATKKLSVNFFPLSEHVHFVSLSSTVRACLSYHFLRSGKRIFQFH